MSFENVPYLGDPVLSGHVFSIAFFFLASVVIRFFSSSERYPFLRLFADKLLFYTMMMMITLH